MQTVVCVCVCVSWSHGSVCLLNAVMLSNSWTQSTGRISSNDMTYIQPRGSSTNALQGKHGPCDSGNTLITQLHTHARAEPQHMHLQM